MTLNLTVPVTTHTDFTPRITVIGVGGGGTNAVDNMILSGLQGVDFVVANTDAQQLQHSKADRRIQLGPHLTQGLGAGAKPEIGRAAAQEAADELMRHLDGTHMVFITAGMGGGTGTGAAPVIAQLARERGLLTVGVVTKPFTFEGARRTKAAEQGINELQQYVDTLIVIPNQNLFRIANDRTGWKEAFKMADQVLYMGVRGVTDLMMSPGLINLDFADIRTVMAEMGKAMMGTGEAEGDDRAIRSAEAAISNPLLEDTSMAGARGLLINITGGDDLTLFEVDQAVKRVCEEVADDAHIIFGSAIDESLSGRIRVSVVATGIDVASQMEAQRPRLVSGGAPVLTEVRTQAAAPALTPSGAGAPQAAAAPAPSGLYAPASAPPVQLLAPRPPQPQMAQHAAEAPQAPNRTYVPPAPVPRPSTSRSAIFSEPSGTNVSQPAGQPAGQPAPPPSQARSLFGIMTRGIRRNAPEPNGPLASRADPRVEPQRAEPSFPPQDAHQAASQAQQPSEEALEIPAFLRRQTST